MGCFKCGASGENTKLFDVITREGIMKICEKCSIAGDYPVIRKPTSFQLKEIERKPGVYERLSKMAGINRPERKIEKADFLIKEESSLRSIVDKNYTEKTKQEAKPRPELVDNFHWTIMRIRRSKKITQKQLADAIGEPEAAIKMAEEGVLPNDNNKLLDKIQNYLGINLVKDSIRIIREGPLPPKEIIFDRKSPTDFTISDLKKIKEEKERVFETYDNYKTEDKEKLVEKTGKDLSDEEIRKLIFKK